MAIGSTCQASLVCYVAVDSMFKPEIRIVGCSFPSGIFGKCDKISNFVQSGII